MFRSQKENYFGVVHCLGLSTALSYLAALSPSGGVSGSWPSSLPRVSRQAERVCSLLLPSGGPLPRVGEWDVGGDGEEGCGAG